MKIFHCGRCDQLVFFENNACVKCGHALAFLPDLAEMGAMTPQGDGTYRAVTPHAGAGGARAGCTGSASTPSATRSATGRSPRATRTRSAPRAA